MATSRSSSRSPRKPERKCAPSCRTSAALPRRSANSLRWCARYFPTAVARKPPMRGLHMRDDLFLQPPQQVLIETAHRAEEELRDTPYFHPTLQFLNAVLGSSDQHQRRGEHFLGT